MPSRSRSCASEDGRCAGDLKMRKLFISIEPSEFISQAHRERSLWASGPRDPGSFFGDWPQLVRVHRHALAPLCCSCPPFFSFYHSTHDLIRQQKHCREGRLLLLRSPLSCQVSMTALVVSSCSDNTEKCFGFVV